MARILIIDDNETIRDGVGTVMHREGHEATMSAGGRQGIEAWKAAEPGFDLVICDLKMEPVDGMEVLQTLRELDEDVRVIIITAHGSVKAAVEAMQVGAFDFIEKPFPVELLKARVTRALDSLDRDRRTERLERENEYLRAELVGESAPALDRIIGSSPPMERVFSLVRRVAGTDSSVHVFGASGTGKELIAAAIHELSPRAAGPFVKVNCGAIPDTLLESELFGHERGAFTDAHKRRIGRFELADGGTLFLDEVGDVSIAMQVKLLRVLQERRFERVGGEKTIEVDVRIITATNKDLKAEVEAGRFREDLYYRLNIIPIDLPPLCERRGDIPELVAHFVARLGARTRSAVTGFSDDALAAMQNWSWPGNVRELENAVEQAMVFADGDVVEIADLPAHISGAATGVPLDLNCDDRPLPQVLDDIERRLILQAFDQADGVKTETARLLGIKTPALYYKLEKYGIGAEDSES